MKQHWVKIVFIVIGILIAVPFIAFGCYGVYSILTEKYAINRLHEAVPDAYKYDYQCYETENGAYQSDFYKFSECHEDFMKDWETEVYGDYVFKRCTINAGIFKPVLIVNTTANCATIEYHCTFWE